ncbi:hypothetical protein CANTEDRAFT_127449, partial [Yamadazyma tenuis ATCC 10573]
MIDSEAIMKSAPFQGDSSYNLSNTTPELLKFQLQEEHKSKLAQLENDDSTHQYTYNEDYINSSFNNHLQTKLDEGDILIEEIPSLVSTPGSDSDASEASIDSSRKLNYLNLKVLIENSVFEINKLGTKSLISLNSVKKLKQVLEEKTELKKFYLSKLAVSQQFIANVVDEDVDSSILFKIVKTNNLLNTKLIELSEEIGELSLRLSNHNLSCLLLGYIEDIKISNNMNLNSGNTSANYKLIFDKLIGYVASLSVQKNINLPPPNDENDSAEEKFNWLKKCVDTLISSPVSSTQFGHSLTNLTVPTASSSRENSPRAFGNDVTDMNNTSILNESSIFSINPSNTPDQKILSDYKTALNDLRFSHQYLIKEFEYSRENSLKIIQDYRKRVSALEKELQTQKGHDSPTSTDDNSFSIAVAKDQEIAKLKKQL